MIRFARRAFCLVVYCLVFASGAVAQDRSKCNCAVYIHTNLHEAVIVDHERGWIDEVFDYQMSNLEPRKSGDEGYRRKQSVDCSVGQMRCAEFPTLKLVVAFLDGDVGFTYAARGYQFTIFSKASLSGDPKNSFYNIQFRRIGTEVRGRVIYTSANGVAAILSEDGRSGHFLVSGAGLLAINGYPLAKVKKF